MDRNQRTSEKVAIIGSSSKYSYDRLTLSKASNDRLDPGCYQMYDAVLWSFYMTNLNLWVHFSMMQAIQIQGPPPMWTPRSPYLCEYYISVSFRIVWSIIHIQVLARVARVMWHSSIVVVTKTALRHPRVLKQPGGRGPGDCTVPGGMEGKQAQCHIEG